MIISKTGGSSIMDKIRKITAVVFGKDYVRKSNEIAPYGYDASPVDNMYAAYSSTNTVGVTIILGYMNTQQKAQKGESRIFATDGNGVFKYNVWLTANGVLIGDSDNPSDYINNLMKWTEFNSIMQSYLTTQNAAISAGVASAGGAYTPPPAPDFSPVKATKIKTT